MKKLLIFSLMAIMAGGFLGCKKEAYVSKFDELPQDRMGDSMKYVQNALTSAPNGWVAVMPTNFGGGFGFYMAFNDASNVTMYSDLTDGMATTSYKSQYRVKNDMGASLSFDTYNYITELNDPDNNVRNGYGGDIDFIYDHTSGDSLIMLGKRYRQQLSFIKATAAQKTQYTSGGYLTAINGFRNFFAAIKNPYITLDDGTKASIETNFSNTLTTGKRIKLTALASSGTTSSGTAKFAFMLDQMTLLDTGLNLAGMRFIKVAWKDATRMAMYTTTGKEYIINSNPVPLIPFSSLFGYTVEYPYKRITIGSTGLTPGVTSAFSAVYNQMLANFTASGRSVTSTAFILVSNSIFRVEINYMSGTSAFVASADYGYTRNGDVITLDNNPVGNVNWPTRIAQITPLANYMLTGPFRMDWASSTVPNSPNLGGLYRTSDVTSFIYGTL